MRSILRATIRLTTGLIVAMSWAAPAEAAPGDLDGSFSGDGWVWTLELRTETNNYLPKGAEDLAIQPDGKIVAVGELQDGASNWYFGVFRYLPGGELDSGFGDAAGLRQTWQASSSRTRWPSSRTGRSWWRARETANSSDA